MQPDFFDQLADLVARELNAAMKAGDDERAAAVFEGLATMLGRTAARIAQGDKRATDTLLIGAEQHAANEAVYMGELMALANLRRPA